MSPQLPEPVRSTMQALASGLTVILGNRLLGVYLGGSASLGDFCECTSDLDFLVVTRGPLSMEDLVGVNLLHRDLLRRYPFAARLEGDYAPLELLVPEGTTEPVPGCEKGKFLPRVGELMLSADNMYNMREHGIAIFGPPPQELLPLVTEAQVRAAVRSMLQDGPDPCETKEESAAEVLNLVRSACALELGVPVSKSDGARWALTRLDESWHPLIQAAQAVRCGRATQADEACLQAGLPGLERWVRSRCG